MTAPSDLSVLVKVGSFCLFYGSETGCTFSKESLGRRSLGRSISLLWALKSLVPTT